MLSINLIESSDIARQLDKEIELDVAEDTELDKTLVEQIGDPLVHFNSKRM